MNEKLQIVLPDTCSKTDYADKTGHVIEHRLLGHGSPWNTMAILCELRQVLSFPYLPHSAATNTIGASYYPNNLVVQVERCCGV